MFHSYSGNMAVTLESHRPTPRERVEAARYMCPDDAAGLVREMTDIPRDGTWPFGCAVAHVRRCAGEVSRRDPHSFVWDGLTAAETIAALAVEAVNEALCESLAS